MMAIPSSTYVTLVAGWLLALREELCYYGNNTGIHWLLFSSVHQLLLCEVSSLPISSHNLEAACCE